jgi:hypothetical protein
MRKWPLRKAVQTDNTSALRPCSRSATNNPLEKGLETSRLRLPSDTREQLFQEMRSQLRRVLLSGASMSALPAINNFSNLLDRRDEGGASREVPGNHVPAGDDHPNDGLTDAMPDQADASTLEIRENATAVIRARITEVLDGHARKSRGHYNFMQLPVPNDKIVITNRRGAYDVMRVLSTTPAPGTTVYVRWLASNRL